MPYRKIWSGLRNEKPAEPQRGLVNSIWDLRYSINILKNCSGIKITMEYRALKIRLYTNRSQSALMQKEADGYLAVYNWALGEYKEHLKTPKKARTHAMSYGRLWNKLKELAETEEYEWLNTIAADVRQHAILDVCAVVTRYFELFDKWKNKKAEKPTFPKFLKKNRNTRFYVTNTHGKIRGNRFHFPHIKEPVRLAELPKTVNGIKAFYVIKEFDVWYVSIVYGYDKAPKPICAFPESAVGIDVGIKTNITLSTGEFISIPDTSKLERRLKYQNRYLARSKGNSKNHRKYLKKLRRTHKRINNIVHDAIHKATTTIAKNHGTVVVEDLNIVGMVKQAKWRSMRRSLQKARMYEIIRQLTYKCQHVYKVDRYFPSSQLCSKCGHQQKMPLSARTYVCPECGQIIDRDLNAARNILAQYISGRVTPVVSC